MDFQIPVNQSILNLVAKVDRFSGSWDGGVAIPEERRRVLEEDASVRSTVAACRLAGIRVTREQVRDVLNGAGDGVPGAAEIAGFSAALPRRFRGWERLLSTRELRVLHAMIVGRDGAPPPPSEWRDVAYEREVFDRDGRAVGLVMQTLPPRLLPETIENLVTWLELELRSRDHHPLLVIAVFDLAFLSASPFPKGNERLASVMIVHMLENAGYDFVRCTSLEEVFEERRPVSPRCSRRSWRRCGGTAPPRPGCCSAPLAQTATRSRTTCGGWYRPAFWRRWASAAARATASSSRQTRRPPRAP